MDEEASHLLDYVVSVEAIERVKGGPIFGDVNPVLLDGDRGRAIVMRLYFVVRAGQLEVHVSARSTHNRLRILVHLSTKVTLLLFSEVWCSEERLVATIDRVVHLSHESRSLFELSLDTLFA